jgi:hypothetical protein
VDFAGAHRDLVVDFLSGALRLPVATAAWPMRFPTDSYWRGELHHICDRPELGARLLAEVALWASSRSSSSARPRSRARRTGCGRVRGPARTNRRARALD